MRVILAAPRGFCAGVNMAIEALTLAIETYGTPVYAYHEIVHNTWVVEQFRQQGVIFVNDLAEVPEGVPLLYSAHGVPPAIRRQAADRHLLTIDATCPLVTKVHREAIHFAEQGYTILLIGHAGHDEVVGTTGEAPQAMRLVESLADADRVDVPDPAKVAYLTQTTLSIDDAARIIEHLRQRFPHIVGPPQADICYATQNRQEAVRLLGGRVGRGLGRRQPEQLEQSAAGRTGTFLRRGGPPDRRTGRHRSGLVYRPGNGNNHGRRQRPETLVQDCAKRLRERFAASIETRTIRPEQLRFALPKPLRKPS